MRPDWHQITDPADPAFAEGATVYVAPAYGIDDLRDAPTVAPDDRPLPHPGWTVERVPPANVPGSRFIARRLD